MKEYNSPTMHSLNKALAEKFSLGQRLYLGNDLKYHEIPYDEWINKN